MRVQGLQKVSLSVQAKQILSADENIQSYDGIQPTLSYTAFSKSNSISIPRTVYQQLY